MARQQLGIAPTNPPDAIRLSDAANPTALVGLTAINGTAKTWKRSDSANALDVSIAPTWTGAHTFSNGVQLGAPTGGNEGAGTINVAGGYYLNGVALAISSGANPTGSVGLTAVNGTATTFMRSDGAPAIDQTIAPTWTGKHTWTQAATGPAINASNSYTGPGAVAMYASTSGTTATSAAVYASSSGTASAIVATNSSTGSAISASTSGTSSAVAITQSGSGAALSATYNNAGSGNAIYATSEGTGATLRIQNTSSGLALNAQGPVTMSTSAGQALTITGVAGSSALQLLTTGMQVGSPTGGDLGAGTINAAGAITAVGINSTTGTFSGALACAPQLNSTNATYYVPFWAGNLFSYTGGFYYNPSTHTLTTSSDRDLKTNIRNIDGALGLINRVNGVRFDWKEGGAAGVGVIAQDVEQVFPELVSMSPNEETKGVNYLGFIAPLIEAVKELTTRILKLEST